ncbi:MULTISPECIES: DNA/RNA helicase domain-containing protein [Streptococcus]|jgi:hypothetical protein|nr:MULTISPECIES: DNA/RNA helicase domain-containing protein [Streptococcus]MDU1740298.1 DNA/RNA helicase domain-containing protein [Streptococcus mitis]OFN99226.1 hypothetical protein HMPREF2613_03615 [Streptococcus sp. HMSC070B10]RRD33950.1 DUF2075 domain-containing protein [Streptococcus sp. OH4692_COT-348]
MTNIENNKFPCWGQYPKNDSIFNYVHTKLDENIIPEIPDEDFRALSDFPLIYIYISPIQSDGRRFYYIGQTIDVSRRTKEHSEKLKKENYERFKEFINGEYIAFYGENISQNLNYIEKLLILTFVEEFNFLNFVNMNKEDGYVGKLLANKDRGNESGKYQALREVVEKDVINNILKFLQENKLIDDKPNLKRVTSSLFAESPFFELTKNQNSILNNILEANDKHIHLIKGGAGTGKTVLLLHLIARLKLKNKESKIAVFVKNTHRDRFKKILTSYGLKPDDNGIDIVTFNQLSETNTEYDYIIIDEAQRTTRLIEGLVYPTGAKNDTDILKRLNEIIGKEKEYTTEEKIKGLKYPSVLHFIKKKFTKSHLIISYDDSQRLRKVDGIDIKEIFNDKDKNKEKEQLKEPEIDKDNICEYTLEAQLRILNGKSEKFAEELVTFIKELLGIYHKKLDDKFINDYKNKIGEVDYFRIASNIEEWVKYVSEKQFRFPEKKSLCLAGYCKPVKKANDYEFIKINSNGDSLKWSMDGEKFRNYANKSTEVGNVYDIHGFDIDFASIYIGKDIYLDEKEKCIKVNKDNSFDTAAKKGVDQIDEFVKNAYYILLTRAVYGQMVYVEDDKLREFLLKIFLADEN